MHQQFGRFVRWTYHSSRKCKTHLGQLMVMRRERRRGIQKGQGTQYHFLTPLKGGFDLVSNRKSCGTEAAITTSATPTITEIANYQVLFLPPPFFRRGGGGHRVWSLCELVKTFSQKQQQLPNSSYSTSRRGNLAIHRLSHTSLRCTSQLVNWREKKLFPTTLAPSKNFSKIMEESELCVDDRIDKSTTHSMGTACIPSSHLTHVLRFWGASTGGKSDRVANGGVGLELFSDDVGMFGDDGERKLCESRYLHGPITNHEAHYAALVIGLRFALAHGVRNILAQGGSPVVVNHITGRNRCQSPNLKPYYEQVVKIRSSFESFGIEYIPRKENSGAVGLAKAAMKLGVSDGINLADFNLKEAEAELHGLEDESKARVNIAPDRTYILHFDGGSRGNPGPAGGGMVLYEDRHDGEEEKRREIWSGRKFVGEMATSNEAEYNALIAGLRCSLALGVKNILVQGDSALVVKQILGEYECRKKNLKPLLEEVGKLRGDFLTFRIEYIPRGKNQRADVLAQKAMDSRESWGLGLDQYRGTI